MMVTSPGLDELTALLEKLRGREDAITRELERRRVDIAAEIAAVEEVIRLLAAEHAGKLPSTADEIPQAPQHVETASQAVQASQTALDAPEAAQEAMAADSEPLEPSVPTTQPEAPATRPRASRGPNWKRDLAGLQQAEAAVRIAQRIGAPVTVAQIAGILVDVGLTRATGKLAHGQANRVLATSTRFERVGRGTYRLRECGDAGVD
jgi:hypothetical protein